MEWSAFAVTQLAAVAALLALAAWLLYLNFESRLHRVLALVLVLRAGVTLLNRLAGIDPPREALWIALREYFFLGLLPAMAYFVVALVLPRQRPLARGLAAAILVAGISIEIAYAWDHCLEQCPLPSGLTRLGPLALLVDGLPLAYGLLGTLLALLAWRGTGAQRIAHGLAAMAFLLQGALDGAIAGALLARFGPAAATIVFEPSLWTTLAFPLRLSALLAVAVGGWILARTARAEGAGAARVVAPLLVAAASGVVIGLSPTRGLAQQLAIALSGLWLLVLPLLLAYAVLKYRLLGLDARVRTGLRRTFVGGAFVATFFVVTEVAQAWMSDRYGLTLGIAASALLVLALAPLHAMGERMARATLPEAPASPALGKAERHAIYREQARVAWSNGSLTRKERLLLDELRTQLGLTYEDAARLERETSPPLGAEG